MPNCRNVSRILNVGGTTGTGKTNAPYFMKDKILLIFWRFMAYNLPYRTAYRVAKFFLGYRKGVEFVDWYQRRFVIKVFDQINFVYGL